jgi:hypothetical protein
MTAHRSFKRLVRTRMAKTGESYTAARAVLLAARTTEDAPAPLATSDERIRERTGRGWEEWFDLLDAAGMAGRSHREVARWVAEQLGVVPLAWAAQAVTGSYERARGGRQVGQHADGFTVTASRTVAVPAEALFTAVVVDRGEWLPGVGLRERTSTPPRSARFDWEDGATRVHVTIDAVGTARSRVTIAHVRLPGAEEARHRGAWWRERLLALKARLEAGASRA